MPFPQLVHTTQRTYRGVTKCVRAASFFDKSPPPTCSSSPRWRFRADSSEALLVYPVYDHTHRHHPRVSPTSRRHRQRHRHRGEREPASRVVVVVVVVVVVARTLPFTGVGEFSLS